MLNNLFLNLYVFYGKEKVHPFNNQTVKVPFYILSIKKKIIFNINSLWKMNKLKLKTLGGIHKNSRKY